MKVLYIGYYKEDSDWGRITENNILALDAAGVDIVCRSINLSRPRKISGRLAEIEQKDLSDCDFCIQHVFPDHLVGSKKFKKNVAILGNTFAEIGHTSVPEKLQQLDEVWVPNRNMACELSGLKVKARYVPFCSDTSKYRTKQKDIQIPQASGKFKFYTILSPDDSKALESVLSAFNSEFNASELATLIIFLTSATEDSNKKVRDISDAVKASLHLQKDVSLYPREIVVGEPNLTQDQIHQVHQYGDSYLDINSGHPWSSNLIDAIGFGSKPITTKWSAPKELDDNDIIKTIDSVFKCKKSNTPRSSELELGKDYFLVPCEKQIKKHMRESYEEWLSNPITYSQKNKSKGYQKAEEFSLKNVGATMKEKLND